MGNLDIKSRHNFTELISKVSLFSGIAHLPEALKHIADIMTVSKFPQGHHLIEQGAKGEDFYILVQGQVSVYKQTPEKDLFKVAVLSSEKHAAFGEGGLIDGEVRSATIICETEIESLVLSQKKFSEFCQQYPQYAVPIITKLAQSVMTRLNQTSHDLILLHQALMNEIRTN